MNIRVILTVLIFLSFTNIGFASSIDDFYNSDIASLEQINFGKTFNNEPQNKRLNRLEVALFGHTNENMSKSDRLNNIISYNSNDNKFPKQETNQQQKVTLKDRFKKTFIGEPTGFTPQFSSELYDCPYINKFGPSFMQGFYGSNGWNDHIIYYPKIQKSF